MGILYFSLLGNIVGIISLFIGIVGVCLTVRTMKNTNRIEAEIKEAKIKALDKKRLNKVKDKYLNTLQRKRKAAFSNQVISYNLCSNVLSIIHDLKGYDKIFLAEDMRTIEAQENRMKLICLDQEQKNETIKLQEFDSIVATIINMLSKGEYDL